MLKLVLETIDDLPEQIQEHYEEKDGKFHLKTEAAGGLAVEDVSGLKSTVSKLRTEQRDLQKKLKQFEGIEDPEAAKTALEKYEELKNADPDKKAKEQFEAYKQQINSQYAKEKDSLTNQLQNMRSQLENNLVRASATEALQKEGARINLMLPHVLSRVKMREADGRYVAEVVDENGNPRVGDSQGNPMTIPQLVQEMKTQEEFSAGFNGTGHSGSGSGSQSGKPAGSSKRVSGSDLNAMGNNLEGIANGEVEVDP